MPHPCIGSACGERGVVLVVALIFLLLLSILGIGAIGRSLLQEHLAGGLRNVQLADMGAEAALRGAEWRLWKTSAQTGAGMKCGATLLTDCYVYDPAAPTLATVKTFRTSAGWLPSLGTEYNAANGGIEFTRPHAGQESAALAHNPRYLIEDLGPELPPGVGVQHESGFSGSASTGRHIYRITSRSVGGNENTLRVLESTFTAKGD